MPKKIAIVNYKGGTAKTTTCISVGHGLAKAGQRVLLVDVDPQGNAGDTFGLKPAKTLYHLLLGQASLEECLARVRDNFDMIPSNKTLVVAEQNIFGEMGRERVLTRRLDNAIDGYDYVLFDCSPSWRLLNQNALLASQMIVLPISMEFFALTGARAIIDELKNIQEFLNHDVAVALVVPTFYDIRNNKSKSILQQLQEFFGIEKVTEPIRVNVKISEAPYYKQTIFEYAPGSHGAKDYELLTKRFLEL